MNTYYAVLDLGSRLFTMSLRLFNEQGEVSTRYAAVESQGVAKMTIDNNPQVVKRIKQLCAITKEKTGVDVKEVYLSYIGGPITVVEYDSSVACTDLNSNHTLARKEDIEKLVNSYHNYSQNTDSVIVDHVIIQYKKDDVPCLYENLEGSYAQRISCRFLLFLAERTHYERMVIALSAANLKCAGLYVGLHASGAQLINPDERAQALVLLDDEHTEIGLYENGILTHYQWEGEGWDKIKEDMIADDPYLRRNDLNISYLNSLDLTQFKEEWYNNTETNKVKQVGSYIYATYLVKIRDTLMSWNANLLLKNSGNVLLTGTISTITGISDFFNMGLRRKLPNDELYTISIAKHKKPEKWDACEPKYANEELNLFSVSLGILSLLEQEDARKSRVVTKEESAPAVPPPTSTNEEDDNKESNWTKILNKLSTPFGKMKSFFSNGDEELSSYNDEKEEKK